MENKDTMLLTRVTTMVGPAVFVLIVRHLDRLQMLFLGFIYGLKVFIFHCFQNRCIDKHICLHASQYKIINHDHQV